MNIEKKYGAVIAGAGVAGLFCALNLPAATKALVLSKGALDESDSYLAQGGICMLRGEEDFDAYFKDTMRAGHFENDERAVEQMIRSSPEIIDDLIGFGVEFARDETGALRFTREGRALPSAHSLSRRRHGPRNYEQTAAGSEIAQKYFLFRIYRNA